MVLFQYDSPPPDFVAWPRPPPFLDRGALFASLVTCCPFRSWCCLRHLVTRCPFRSWCCLLRLVTCSFRSFALFVNVVTCSFRSRCCLHHLGNVLSFSFALLSSTPWLRVVAVFITMVTCCSFRSLCCLHHHGYGLSFSFALLSSSAW